MTKDEALNRFALWNELPQIGPLVPCKIGEAVGRACDERGMWRGRAVVVSEVSGWTLFQDLSGALSGIPGREWLEFAQDEDVIFAGYNDSISYGELVAVSGGVVIREFLYDRNAPEANVNLGKLADLHEPLQTWIEVAEFVDEDPFGFSDVGWLWIY